MRWVIDGIRSSFRFINRVLSDAWEHSRVLLLAAARIFNTSAEWVIVHARALAARLRDAVLRLWIAFLRGASTVWASILMAPAAAADRIRVSIAALPRYYRLIASTVKSAILTIFAIIEELYLRLKAYRVDQTTSMYIINTTYVIFLGILVRYTVNVSDIVSTDGDTHHFIVFRVNSGNAVFFLLVLAYFIFDWFSINSLLSKKSSLSEPSEPHELTVEGTARVRPLGGSATPHIEHLSLFSSRRQAMVSPSVGVLRIQYDMRSTHGGEPFAWHLLGRRSKPADGVQHVMLFVYVMLVILLGLVVLISMESGASRFALFGAYGMLITFGDWLYGLGPQLRRAKLHVRQQLFFRMGLIYPRAMSAFLLTLVALPPLLFPSNAGTWDQNFALLLTSLFVAMKLARYAFLVVLKG